MFVCAEPEHAAGGEPGRVAPGGPGRAALRRDRCPDSRIVVTGVWLREAAADSGCWCTRSARPGGRRCAGICARSLAWLCGLAGHAVWSARLRVGELVADGGDVVDERVHVC